MTWQEGSPSILYSINKLIRKQTFFRKNFTINHLIKIYENQQIDAAIFSHQRCTGLLWDVAGIRKRGLK